MFRRVNAFIPSLVLALAVPAGALGEPLTSGSATGSEVRLAEALVAAAEQAEAAGEPLCAQYLGLKLTLYRHLSEAQIIAAADDQAGKIAAASAYLARCRGTHDLLFRRRGQDVTQLQLALAKAEIARAEYVLAQIQTSDDLSSAAARTELQRLAEARVTALQDAVLTTQQRMDVGEQLSQSFVELRLELAQMLFDAQCATTEDRGEKIAAAEVYLKQCRDFFDVLYRRIAEDVTLLHIRRAEAEVACAEYALAALRSGDDQTTAAAGMELQHLAAAKVAAHQAALKAIEQRQAAGESVSPFFVEYKAAALRRLFEAQIAAATDPTSRAAAADAYLDGSRRLLDVHSSHQLKGLGQLQRAQAQYHLTMAKLRIAELPP